MTLTNVALVGAARAGTSFLYAYLSRFSEVAVPHVKEPNFYSANYHRGSAWYESIFPSTGLRFDASTSYTSPVYPDALPRLAADSPSCLVLYSVRSPVERMYSHYVFRRHYLGLESEADFEKAVRASPLYVGASDYGRWLALISSSFDPSRVLVVPFGLVKDHLEEVARAVNECVWLGELGTDAQANAQAHRNAPRAFKTPSLARAVRAFKRSHLYPVVRRTLGPARVRGLRESLVTTVDYPPLAEVLEASSQDFRDTLQDLQNRANRAVAQHLREQDLRLDLRWAQFWTDDSP